MVFIVFEGIDNSGKSTQSKLLVKHLKKEGYKVEIIDFPQYGKKSAGLIEEYLSGKYGSADEVSPYIASIFYACDRYDASFKIRKWLEKGKVVIADRYIGSNIGHQGGKIKNKKERLKFIKWIYNLEYNIFKIPKPDITFILKTSPELSLELAKKKKATDIHERNLLHLKEAFNAYLEAAKIFPKDFKVINCIKGKKFLSKEEIHQKIWKFVEKLL
jgi:dTMP kinase